MADTGYNWDTSWTAIAGQAALVLTTGGTDDNTSAELSLDGKAACAVTVDADYSNHAKATGGLFVFVCSDINGTDFETEADGPWGFEMPFLQNGTRRKKFFVDPKTYPSFKIYLDWDNSTASSNVTVTTKVKYATIPVAS